MLLLHFVKLIGLYHINATLSLYMQVVIKVSIRRYGTLLDTRKTVINLSSFSNITAPMEKKVTSHCYIYAIP